MKILHVLNSLGFGGTEKWLLEIVRYNNNSLQFDFLITGGEESVFDEQFRSFGCNLHYLKFDRNNLIYFISELNQIVKKNDYQILHDHEDFVAGWHWLFLIFNLPRIRITHAHNSNIYIDNYVTGTGRFYFYKLGKLLNGFFSTYITGTSDKLLDELGYVGFFYGKKRIEPLYCGVNYTEFVFNESERLLCRESLSINEIDKVVIFVGRIDCPRDGDINHKNPAFAFTLAKKAATLDGNVVFLFVGEKGRRGNEMESEARELGLENQIRFLGKRSDVGKLMNLSDIFLFTSIVEPFGIVLVEAQYCGLLIVSSDILTHEIIEFESQFFLLDLAHEEEWLKRILTLNPSSQERINFLRTYEDAIKKGRFGINASYSRLLKYYMMIET